MECCLLSIQVQVLRRYQKFRKLWSIISLLLVSVVSLVLLTHIREAWLSFLYVVISACLTYLTLNRNFRKLEKFNV
ncbi:hypothetical protein FHG87_020257 [Trinorchestia longiramus]|nr:hypothetical protein FHG87_020257 [Trinorchestia longiramus]